MALDPSIILRGQPVNALAAYQDAARTAGVMNEFARQRQLQDIYRTQGAGIAAGDPAAMNALSGYDPSLALQVQDTRQGMAARDLQMEDTRLGMQAQRQRMDILSAQERRQAEEYARGLSADQRAAEAAQIEGAVKMGLAIQTPQEWDAVMSTQSPDLVGMFGQREAIAARYMSMAEVLKMNRPSGFRPASQDEAAKYGAAGGQFGPDGKFYPINPPTGMSVETGPDGQVRVTQGPGVTGKPLTEGQSKDLVYSTRARGALDGFNDIAPALTDRVGRLGENIPLGLGREYLQSDQFQVAKQKGDEFLQAILRKDTGAAITAQEQELYGKTYLPQPGDSQAALQAKAEARQRALLAIEAGMPPAAILAQEKALEAGNRGDGSLPRAGVVEDGYRFKGGNPADPNAWEKVQ